MSDDILTKDNVVASGEATTRDEAIAEAGRMLVQAGAVTDAYVDAMRDREKTVSTYMGNFLAIPHGTNEAKDEISRSMLSFVRYTNPIDWDGDEVRFVVGIAGVGNEHLEILSKIAIVFSEEESVQQLIDAPDADALYALLEEVNEE
ncbi:PTS system D-mannitol-specific IIA component, Fru family [Paramicrobacterium humi]|uniref:Mannitol-specific phosphotransferase enzyme IIA component n=1 Tax=Paramicrobacterium humi TaxID=640635 RepID=A0A1H4J080_9MICO|nr:PTS sugar transporter subunit IIA [Microbacterium humi]SEB39724.1 PTS system D-mannitol-specific IIA component, Fru family [Microbacterium humi]